MGVGDIAAAVAQHACISVYVWVSFCFPPAPST